MTEHVLWRVFPDHRDTMLRARKRGERRKVGRDVGFSANECGVSFRPWLVHAHHLFLPHRNFFASVFHESHIVVSVPSG